MTDQSPKPRLTSAPISGIERFDTGVNLGGLMSVLSEHLYSTPDVAVRELVQNAHDSILRRRWMENNGQSTLSNEDPQIRVTTDTVAQTLEVADNGSGLTQDEIHQMLATIGVGATGQLRQETENPDLIGLFGLGFLSTFVVADEVVVTTTSAKTPTETFQYRSADGYSYSVLPAQTAAVGTTVTLQLKAGYSDLSNDRMILSILDRYCRLLNIPISLNNGPAINLDAPWRWESSTREDRLKFAAAFDQRFEPLAAVPIEAEGQSVRGQMWVHGGSTYGNADNRSMSVFVRGMLLAENDIDLLPRWAGFVSGVIESPDLTPTASRETLQNDAAYTEAQMVIAEALIVGLSDTALHDPPAWRRILQRHSQALLGAAVTDDRLFQLVADQVVLPSTQGERTVAALRHGRRLYVSLGADGGFEELLFLARGIPVINGSRYGVVPFLRMYANKHGLDVVEIGTDGGNADVFEPVTLADNDLQWLQAELASEGEAIYPARFDPEEVPLVVVPDREAELKQRLESDELDASAGSGAAGLARLHTAGIEERSLVRVYVNMGCPTVQRVLELREQSPVGAMRAATLLRTLKTMMAASDRGRGGSVGVTQALSDALMVIDGLLIEGMVADE